eukprot:TRINITY_DN20068_c0_g1_i1.p1 TRINITY_DN20068_c0_g1~~TRINITY_DN20068_c0_g1_i1.p1  ORF type:complete len:486 (+),score=85.71 TRINITY_DN20068_c0_g1_i1:36-1460(+)
MEVHKPRTGRGYSSKKNNKKPSVCLLFIMPNEVVTACVEFLSDKEVLGVELACKKMKQFVEVYRIWETMFKQKKWRAPVSPPDSWKQYYHTVMKQREVAIKEKINNVSCTLCWRVDFPIAKEPFKKRSREFEFSHDALGSPIKWQIESELKQTVSYEQAAIRIWTTNSWTPETTDHYYGSHCTVSVRDCHDKEDLLQETTIDIDNSKDLRFDAVLLPENRELLLKVNLTLALEVAVPLEPFYTLISHEPSDSVRIGYCRAIFEIARCKRKHGSTFIQQCDSNVGILVNLAASNDTSNKLKAEVFQALFNLLSPSSVFIPDELAGGLMNTCIDVITEAALPAVEEREALHLSVVLAQNALGSAFNLLVHPVSKKLLTAPVLRQMEKLLSCPAYKLCNFSVITVVLTAVHWGTLPASHADDVVAHYMAANNPLDPDCTGVAWDESDIAAYFLPLLRSKNLTCVVFATWCITAFYHD